MASRSVCMAVLLGLAGCAPKTASVVSAPSALPTATAFVLTPEEGPSRGVPQGLADGLDGLLSARNLVVQDVAPDAFAGPFGTRQATPHRLAWLADQGDAPALVLLVEAQVRFYSQLAGRYRWTVRVEASLAPVDQLEAAVVTTIEVPVFLQFHHEREGAALAAAAPAVERQVAWLLDSYLGGLAP